MGKLSFIFPLTLTISTPVESFHFGSIQLIGNGTCRFYKCCAADHPRELASQNVPPSNVNQERRKLPPPAARAAASRRAPSSIVGRQG